MQNNSKYSCPQSLVSDHVILANRYKIMMHLNLYKCTKAMSERINLIKFMDE